MLKFLLLVNKQGHTRVSQYYEYLELEERTSMEAEITRKCLTRNDNQCPFFEFKNFKVIYKRYASLFFIVGVDSDENELAILEFIHNFVETLDRYFSSVCELDFSTRPAIESNVILLSFAELSQAKNTPGEINGCVEDLNQLFCEMARRGDVDYQNRDVPDHIADVYHRAMLL